MAEHSIEQIFDAAAGDRLRGAAEIEHELIRHLLAAENRWHPETLRRGAEMLVQGQPAMANLRNLAEVVGCGEIDAVSRWLHHRDRVLARLPRLLASNAWPSIRDAAVAVTISRSSAVAAVVQGAWSRGWNGGVVVLDGGAAGCGKDQARLLATRGETAWCPDTMAGKWLDRKGVIVVIGADAVGSGSFINASGTAALLVTAENHGHCRLVVADSGKDVAENVIDEILDAAATSVFERVPCGLISDRISERREPLC